jgi:MFS transporter, DHA1 family, inner membrane transport protein
MTSKYVIGGVVIAADYGYTAPAAAGAALAAGGLVVLTISVLCQHREAVHGQEHDGSNT